MVVKRRGETELVQEENIVWLEDLDVTEKYLKEDRSWK